MKQPGDEEKPNQPQLPSGTSDPEALREAEMRGIDDYPAEFFLQDHSRVKKEIPSKSES